MASAMKYQPGIIAPGRLAYMYGVSQTGRTLRQIIYKGFTIDEQGRKVFDAAFIKTGGASMARFNERFALVNSLGVFTETQFPFQYQMTTDPVTGKRDGMGARIPAGLEPKIFTLRHRLRVLGQGPSRGAAARVGRWHRGSARCRQRAGLLRGRRRGTAPARCRRPMAAGSSRTTLSTTPGRARADGGARCLDAGGQGAAAEPASAIRRWHDGSPPPAQVPGRPRRAMAD